MSDVVTLAEVRRLDSRGKVVLDTFDPFSPADETTDRVHLWLLGHRRPVGFVATVELVPLDDKPSQLVEIVDTLLGEPGDERRESGPVRPEVASGRFLPQSVRRSSSALLGSIGSSFDM